MALDPEDESYILDLCNTLCITIGSYVEAQGNGDDVTGIIADMKLQLFTVIQQALEVNHTGTQGPQD